MKVDGWPGTSLTLAATGGKVVIERPMGVSLGLAYNDGSVMYPGAIITGSGETSPDLKLVAATHTEPSGIAIRMVGTAAATAPDTVFTDNEPIEYAAVGSGCVCAVKFTSNAGWFPGQYLISKGDGTGQGTFLAGTTAHNHTSFGYHFLDIIGRAVTYQTDTSTPAGIYTYVYSLVRLSM
jgi:hypothetical protein